ncbi:40S ribosomal protein S21 [Galemys pyrenaicus]|uniref:40S ribosomal protein S21 n=1 Tax=Galemys pyrenaicus TaxID=202257 RepID=A0A8J6A0N2_GALPY|nr:40S ribosomal protein S21 [Galemys pyrenaicus]
MNVAEVSTARAGRRAGGRGRGRPSDPVPRSQVDKVTGRFNGQFKTYAICGAIRRMVSAGRPPAWALLGGGLRCGGPGGRAPGLTPRMLLQGESDDSILRLAKGDCIVSK